MVGIVFGLLVLNVVMGIGFSIAIIGQGLLFVLYVLIEINGELIAKS
jgi:hypothetical protein